MRRALQGRLNLLQAAQAIPQELMSYSPLAVQLPDEPLALQEHMVKMSKKIALMVAGLAAQKFGADLVKEQEVLAKVADMIIEIFAMESGLLRTKKIIESRGEDKAKFQIAAVETYVDQTIPTIEMWAKQALAYVEQGDTLRTQLAGVKKLARYTPIDTVSRLRAIADRVIELESYPF